MSADEMPDRGEIFDLLSNHRRRYTIHFCKQNGDGPVTVSDLAEQVASWELDKEISELTSAERKRVYTSLQQTHLPTLDRAGMVLYENGEVELTKQAATMEVYMDIVPGNSIPWGEYYLGLSIIGALVLAGVWFEILPTETVPELGWAFAVLVLFAGSAAYHVYQGRQNRLGEMERPP